VLSSLFGTLAAAAKKQLKSDPASSATARNEKEKKMPRD
jgi:hypothetical protein